MADLPPPQPAGVSLVASLAGPMASALVGVLMRHARGAADGKPLSLTRIALDLPSVLGLGIIGGAIGDWLGGSETVRCGIAAALGYLGPRVIDAALTWWMSRRPPPP